MKNFMILLEKEEDYKQKINCERAKKTAGGLSTTCPLPMHAWAPITRAVTSAYCDVLFLFPNLNLVFKKHFLISQRIVCMYY